MCKCVCVNVRDEVPGERQSDLHTFAEIMMIKQIIEHTVKSARHCIECGHTRGRRSSAERRHARGHEATHHREVLSLRSRIRSHVVRVAEAPEMSIVSKWFEWHD